MKSKIGNVSLALFILYGLSLNLVHAQTFTPPNADVSNLSDYEVELKAIEMTTPEPASNAPASVNFYSAKNPGWPPFPANIHHDQIWDVGGGFVLLDDIDYDYGMPQTTSFASGNGMRAMDESEPPIPEGGSGTNGGGGGSSFQLPAIDYSSNLWIHLDGISNGNLVGIISNSQAGVEYVIQTRQSLSGTDDWVSIDPPILGSGLTNWTALNTVPISLTNNLFFRIQSQASSDGSGIPDWWQEEYGLTNVDPNAQDSAGDGWTIYQKYEMDLAPDAYATPPAPQGLTVSYNSDTGIATVSWLPSPGTVTNYTVQRQIWGLAPTNLDFSAETTEFADDLSAIVANYNSNLDANVIYGWTEPAEYAIQAHYADGDSAWSSTVLVEPSGLSMSMIPGPAGTTCIAASMIPPGTTLIRLRREAPNPPYYSHFDIPVGSFTNGLFFYPNTLSEPQQEYGLQLPPYQWLAMPVFTDIPGIGADLGWSYSVTTETNVGETYQSNANYQNWSTPPFFDGRRQLKENLIFLLRAGTVDFPLQFTDVRSFNGSYPSSCWITHTNTSASYVHADFYELDADNTYPGSEHWGGDGAAVNGNSLPYDVYWPFEENYRYRNFVYDPAEVDGNGRVDTGVNGSYDPNYSIPFVGEGYSTPMILVSPPTHVFEAPATNGTTLPSVLGTDETQWLATYPFDSSEYTINESGDALVDDGNLDEIGMSWSIDSDYDTYLTMASNAKNIYGLPFLSVKMANSSGATVFSPGDTLENVDGYFYPETAQPELQTAEYDFWNANVDVLPGMTNFTTGQASGVLIAAVGKPNFQVAGYAKLSVLNGYSGVYGYLGQYFDQAYQIDDNGSVTTNQTGVLSPYGSFFATEPGAVALVTMPDIDTGERGTGVVYCVSLQFDKNHDGTMDTSFNGADATSQASPFRFWSDQNFDRWKYDPDDSTNYMDDVSSSDPAAGCPLTPNASTPDCNYQDAYGNRVIPTTRDLEDFTRLWVAGITTNLLAALPSGSTIMLNWGDVGSPNSANPTIDLFQATDADGGIEYLTNETAAANQIDPTQAGYVGRLAPGGSIQLNAIQFANNWAGNHFIWCGVTNGSGSLNMTIADGSGNVLAQSTAYLQIQDIKLMYERWTVGDQPSRAPMTNVVPATDGLAAGVPAFQYTAPPDTNTPYILFVHGWNLQYWEKDRFAETAYKRLYWQGYQGRFGEFRWPTGYGFSGLISVITDARNYDNSESNAWASAIGLFNKLTDLNIEYPGNVYLMAHSMGNVVAGEALRLAETNQVVNTYVAAQGAVSAHCYDPSTVNRITPDPRDCYAGYWTNGAQSYFNGSAGAGSYVDFFNTNDFALSYWNVDQNFKPDDGLPFPGYYYATPSDTHPSGFYKIIGSNDINLLFPDNTYEIFAYADPSWSYALGAQANVGGAFSISKQVELDSSPYNFGSQHLYHSVEFRLDNPQNTLFWSMLLSEMRLK